LHALLLLLLLLLLALLLVLLKHQALTGWALLG
jgi:hypothetical protein